MDMDEGLLRELAKLQNQFGVVPDLDEHGRLVVTRAQFNAIRAEEQRRWSTEPPQTRYNIEIVVAE